MQHLPYFVPAVQMDRVTQITLGDSMGNVKGFFQGAGDAADQQQAETDGKQHTGHDGENGPQTQSRITRQGGVVLSLCDVQLEFHQRINAGANRDVERANFFNHQPVRGGRVVGTQGDHCRAQSILNE